MTTALLTAYVLVWPAIVAGVLLVIVRAFVRELRRARAEGRRII
ncbi:MAG TPA: putative transporter small subunit [Actinotalea caeni]|nr:putative transporter small subunit [Actinotalea caeni]HLV56679.1 putative transporter small subunit [Actinotalea caeni]